MKRNTFILGAVLLPFVLQGCGGGVMPYPSTGGTRAKAKSIIKSMLGAEGQTSGNAPSLGMNLGNAPGGGGEAGNVAAPRLDMYFRNLGCGNFPGRSRQSPPPGDNDYSYFYYDEWLQLWIDVKYTSEVYRQDMYLDEAKSQPAGFVESIMPLDWTVFPIVYSNRYRFDKGPLAVSWGDYLTKSEADGTFFSTYENTSADGSFDKGKSSYTPGGDYTYESTSTLASGAWTKYSGTYRMDGSGESVVETSDGYTSTFTFNADGSGKARIEGNDPLLPATITWDAEGNVVIRYADGSVEKYNRWAWFGGGASEGGTGKG
ncbi:MAG: hypothetical protein ACKO14_15015 [Armatimonadota bacterium]